MARNSSCRSRLSLTRLEDRTVPTTAFPVLGAAAGSAPMVQVFRPTGQLLASFLAYDSSFTGGVTADTGEIDGFLGTVEVVTGAGAGGGPHVRVFSVNVATGLVTPLVSFYAFDPSFAGGVSVAAGNVNPFTAVDEVVVGAGPGGGPHVRTFDVGPGFAVPDPGPLSSFYAFDPNFGGGVNVAVGNFDSNLSDGAELATAAGPGGGPHVKVFRSDGAVIQSFFAFQADYTGGVGVSASAPDLLGRSNLQIVALNRADVPVLFAVNPLGNVATPPVPGTFVLVPPRTAAGASGRIGMADTFGQEFGGG